MLSPPRLTEISNFIQYCIEDVIQCYKQEKEIKNAKLRKEEIELSFVADNVIKYV